MTAPINAAAVAALSDEPLDWRFKGIPASWWGRSTREVCAQAPRLLHDRGLADGAVGPLGVLRADALTGNLDTMARWCREHDVELAPHVKTHMAPQLMARQLAAGACALTVATISQVRTLRAFGVRDVVLANQLVDPVALGWLAVELDADADFSFVCWVDSPRGVETMTRALTDAGADRAVDVCVEVGMAGGRTGCRTPEDLDAVARAVLASPRLRLVGVAGYEAALSHDEPGEARAYLKAVRAAAARLAPLVEIDRPVVTAGGSSYFDVVAEELAGPWRTILRSGCYLTHDVGLYARTSPLRAELRPALSVWAQVLSCPEPGLALVGMGRRDVSFDQGLPVPRRLPDSRVTRLNDQHAYLMLGAAERVEVGDWLEFGISHPCTTFDKWQLIPMVDEQGRVVDLIRTFF